MFRRISSAFPSLNWKILIILALTFLVYFPIISHQFIWDDRDFIINWQLPTAPLSLISSAFLGDLPSSHQGVYRPVRSLAYSLTRSIFGSNPALYHLFSIAIHLINTFLVYRLFILLLPTHHQALIGSLFFSLHPLSVESIAWITASFDMLGFTLALLSILIAITNQSSANLKLSALFYFFAILTYELTLTIPILIFFAFKYLKQNYSLRSVFTPYLIAFTAYLLLRLSFLQPDPTFALPQLSLSTRLLLPILVIANHLSLILFPLHLQANYQLSPGISSFFHLDLNEFIPPPQLELSNQLVLLSITMIFCLLVTLFFISKNYSHIKLGLAWITVSLLPVAQIMIQKGIFANRYAYFSLVGFSLVLVSLFQFKPTPPVRHFKLLSLAIPVVLIFYIYQIHTNLPKYQSNLSFWSKAVEQFPTSAGNRHALAQAQIDANQFNQALVTTQVGLDLNPSIQALHRNHISLLFTQQDYNLVIKKASKLPPNYLDEPLQYFLAISSVQTGAFQQATPLIYSLLDRYPNEPSLNQALQQISNSDSNP